MILDQIDHIEISDDVVNEHYDAIQALARLREGLFWLAHEVGKIESTARDDAASENVQHAIVGGVLAGKPMGLLACAFQWYAVSACNYAQLVGWLNTPDKEAAKEYVKQVMPRLLMYRHKVAAHFALTDPRRDNEADLAASVMTQVVYTHGRLCAAAISRIITNKGQEIIASRDLSWSLTLAHGRLTPRYWPTEAPRATQALKVEPGETIKMNISWSDLLWHDE